MGHKKTTMKNSKYLQWAMFLILFALPSYELRFKLLGIPVTVLEVLILATFAWWFIGSYREIINNIKLKIESAAAEKIRFRYPFDVEIVLLLIISFVSVGVAGFSNEALGIWKAYFFEPLLLYVLLFNVFASPSRSLSEGWSSIFAKIIWPLTIAAFLISVFAIYQKLTGNFIANPFWSAVETRRVTSVFAYPNALGLYLAPLILLIIGKLISALPRPAGEGRARKAPSEPRALYGGEGNGRWLKSIFLAITIILSLLSIYFAYSEGALVGILAGLALFGMLIDKKWRLATVGVLVLGVIIFLSIPDMRNKVLEKATLTDFSGEVRKQQWRETWAMLTESPQRFILGAGLANYQSAVKPYHQDGIFFNEEKDPKFRNKLVFGTDQYKKEHWRPVEVYLYPHNIFLNFWSELGLLGALLMFWMIGKFYYLGFRQLFQNSSAVAEKIQNSSSHAKENYIIIALLAAMTAIVIHGAVDVPYFKNDLSVLFWTLIALMGMVNLFTNSEEK